MEPTQQVNAVNPPTNASSDTQERRKRAARIFAWIGLSALIILGASWLQRVYPHAVEIRYLYRDVADVHLLRKVEVLVLDTEGTKGRAVFFHHQPIPASRTGYFRRQRLHLAKGVYRVDVTMHFAQHIRRYRTNIHIREAGIYYIYLKRASSGS